MDVMKCTFSAALFAVSVVVVPAVTVSAEEVAMGNCRNFDEVPVATGTEAMTSMNLYSATNLTLPTVRNPMPTSGFVVLVKVRRGTGGSQTVKK